MMLPELESYDWREAFAFAGEEGGCNNTGTISPAFPTDREVSLEPFSREDVVEIVAMSEGENDGDNWLIVGKLKDSRYFVLSAGCDYTGWD